MKADGKIYGLDPSPANLAREDFLWPGPRPLQWHTDHVWRNTLQGGLEELEFELTAVVARMRYRYRSHARRPHA